jgi:hypothetical protein
MDRSEKGVKNCRIWFDSTREIEYQDRWSRKFRSFYVSIYHQIAGVNSYVSDLINTGHLLYLVVCPTQVGIHIS